VTILLVNSFANAGTCGVNWFNTMQTGQTIGTVAKVKIQNPNGMEDDSSITVVRNSG
jgi:hypothetical protein